MEHAAAFLSEDIDASALVSSIADDEESWISFLQEASEERDEFLSHMIDHASFSILAKLIKLYDDACSNIKGGGEVIFGRDFIERVAPSITADNSVLIEGTEDLLTALLAPRPRNSMANEEVHTLLLLPLSKTHPVMISEILMESVVQSVSLINQGSEEEVAMKRETAALSRIQDLREVIELLCRYCVDCLNSEEGRRMIDAFGKIYEVAPFALESQLETLLNEDAALILGSYKTATVEEMEVDPTNEFSPLYANLAASPLQLTPSQLEAVLEEIHEKICLTDSERWDERLSALLDLERILASGLQGEAVTLFIEKLRKMPLHDQFADLRSQVTHAACRVLTCVSYEYRDFIEADSSLVSSTQQVIDNCLPALLKLCTSGTRLMANQGVICVLSICATSTGHSRLFNTLCEEIIDKKSKNNNKKRAAVMGVTAALRTWDEGWFKNVDLIAKAVREANSNRDPIVREEGRKAYWAMESCGKTKSKAEELYGERSREYRNLLKCREEVDAEWNEGGKMHYLLNTGVFLEENKGKGSAVGVRPSAAPPRVNSNKRPVSSKTGATPASKTGRFSTPAKVASQVAGSTSKCLSSANATPSSRLSTLAPSMTTTSTLQTPSINSDRRSKQTPGDDSFDEKENEPLTPTNQILPKDGTPIVSILARPSPLSIAKSRSRNALNQVVTMLSDTNNPSEQYLGIQVLALFAKENSEHETWENMFDVVLELLLGLTVNTQTDEIYDSINFAPSPSKNLGSRYEAQHLYLQGIRSLLQFVPGRFGEKHVKDVMNCLLECTNAPFEIVHTCERALQNLVIYTNPEICFECIMSYLSNTHVDLDSETNPPGLLSSLRTLKHLIEFIPLHKLRQVTPEILQLFHSTIRHKSVDMRKATVFVLVEMYYILGQELSVDGFSEGQKRLIDVYIERHPKKNAMIE